MGVVNKMAKIVWLSVKSCGSEEVDPVVIPIEASCKVGDRHDFYKSQTCRLQLRQLTAGIQPGTLWGKSADVHFVDDLSFKAHTSPAVVGPWKVFPVDNLRRSVGTLRLESRG